MEVFQENVKKYHSQTVRLTKILSRLSLLRLLTFIISSTILITSFSYKLFTIFYIVFPISVLIFAVLLHHYTKRVYLKNHTAFLKKINEQEILRIHCKLGEFDAGDAFINHHHPYAFDLDIFGQHSIFQLVNRTTTESGTDLLSKWLSSSTLKSEILDRQKAIKELAQKLDWRQDFQALGMHFQNKKSNYNKLLTWVTSPNLLLKNRMIYTGAAIILSVFSLWSLHFFLTHLNSPNWNIYFLTSTTSLLINYLILKKVRPIAEDIVTTSQENIDIIRSYQKLVYKIEHESFESIKLVRLQSFLSKNNYSASKEIKKFYKLLDFAQQRGVNKLKMPIKGNPFYGLLNFFLLMDIHMVIGTEKWKSKNKAFLESWANAISEFEALNSIAGFCFANPSFSFPEITEKNNYVHFESLGHPLLVANKRVCNNFSSERTGHITMITGSNMGGKSTFLRTIGVNIVLALAGAPCCATYAKVSNLNLFTSMRTQDNLKEGISSFYAELNRIEEMLKLIMNNDNVFFLLDEIFKGTNSEDRHKGGYSLIHQMSTLKTSGIIATHDIELAKVSERTQLVTNYSFNSMIKNHAMIFDYKIHPSICHDFNASELMKKSGIKILSGISKK